MKQSIFLTAILSLLIFITGAIGLKTILVADTDRQQVINKRLYTSLGVNGYGKWSESYTPGGKNVYYLDAQKGNDATGNGSKVKPWKTLSKAIAIVKSGDTVYLNQGNYGAYRENNIKSRTNWITYSAAPDAKTPPIIESVNITNTSAADAYIRFDGINFAGKNPAITKTKIPAYSCVRLTKCNNIEIRNCEIHEFTNNKFRMSSAMYFTSCKNVLIYHNHIHSISDGICLVTSENITVSNNLLNSMISTPIQYGIKCNNCIIEYNNIYDSCKFDPANPDVKILGWSSYNNKNGKWETNSKIGPHGSGITLRQGNVIVRNNILHSIGVSSCIMFYTGTVPAFNNVLVENNLLYNTYNAILRLKDIGNNIYIRNNTLVGYSDPSAKIAPNLLYIAINVESIAAGHDGSGLHVLNNIIAGRCTLSKNAEIKNNIIWVLSFYESKGWIDNYQDNIIVAGRNSTLEKVSYFTKGFFNGIDSVEDFKKDLEGSERDNFTFSVMDYSLKKGSPAINYGSADNQPEDSLATGDSRGFIKKSGSTRDSVRHSSGCYEFLQ